MNIIKQVINENNKFLKRLVETEDAGFDSFDVSNKIQKKLIEAVIKVIDEDIENHKEVQNQIEESATHTHAHNDGMIEVCELLKSFLQESLEEGTIKVKVGHYNKETKEWELNKKKEK